MSPLGSSLVSAHSCLGRALHPGGPVASGGRKRASFFYGAYSGNPLAPVSLPYTPICCGQWPEVPKPGDYVVSTWTTGTAWEEGSPDPQGRSGCAARRGLGVRSSCRCSTHGRVFHGAGAASGRCVCGFLSRTAAPATPAPAPVKAPGPALCSRGSTAERSPYPGLQDTYYWRTGPTLRIRLPSCLGHICVSRPPRLLPPTYAIPPTPCRIRREPLPFPPAPGKTPPIFRSAQLQSQPLKPWPP